eukprot:TRINITY_DN67647_c0_g1_i1.p1 TRINITY_DN67647_c0_g1~~TRINITY_DN67647_c0_g1_i1.p1  ORF type:complete len:962 (+),score=156.30 TRINITY_DN67647_c0_g1_i1:125-3010(+)
MPNGISSFEALYDRGQVLGRGASGVAFVVRPKKEPSQQFVAKELCVARFDAKRKRDAYQESQFLKELCHPNIVKCIDVFQDEEMMYIVMEYANGGDLSGRLADRKAAEPPELFPEPTVMAVFVQICAALQHCHSRKIVHRDLKPPNIFIVGEGDLERCTVKLGDFGIAKMVEGTMGQAHSTVGTPSYLSPEICKNHPYGMKSDIWSLGIILYELANLRVPFHAGNLPAMALMICTTHPKPLPEGFSAALSELVMALLQKDPTKRPAINVVLQNPYVNRLLSEELKATLPPESASPLQTSSSTTASQPASSASSQSVVSRTQNMPDVHNGSSANSAARGLSQPNSRGSNRSGDHSAARLPSCGPNSRANRQGLEEGWCWRRANEMPDPERRHSRGSLSSKGSGNGKGEPTPRGGWGTEKDRPRVGKENNSKGHDRERDKGTRLHRQETSTDMQLESITSGADFRGRARLEGGSRSNQGYRPAARNSVAGAFGEEKPDRLEKAARNGRDIGGHGKGDSFSTPPDGPAPAPDSFSDNGPMLDLCGWGESAERQFCSAAEPVTPSGQRGQASSLESTPRRHAAVLGACHGVDYLELVSAAATPDRGVEERSDDWSGGLAAPRLPGSAGTASVSSATPVAPPELPQPPLPFDPPSSAGFVNTLHGTLGSADPSARVRTKHHRRRGRPPLLAGQEAPLEPGDSPLRQRPTMGEHGATASSPGENMSFHSTAPAACIADRPEKPDRLSNASLSSARSLSPIRKASTALLRTELEQMEVLKSSGSRRPDGSRGSCTSSQGGFNGNSTAPLMRHSGSAPALPPLPPVTAPSRGAVRSRSQVSLGEGNANGRGYTEARQRAGLLRASSTLLMPDQVFHMDNGLCGGLGPAPPLEAPPPQQPPPPRSSTREETTAVRLTPKLLAPQKPLGAVGSALLGGGARDHHGGHISSSILDDGDCGHRLTSLKLESVV